MREYPVGNGSNPQPTGIAAGPDGNLWFGEYTYADIGRMTLTGAPTFFSEGIGGAASPEGMTAGPDGNLWYTSTYADRLGRITPSGVISEFKVPGAAGAHPRQIVTGPDGNLWYTQKRDAIGRITPSGAIDEFANGISGDAGLWGIAAGPDGNLWVTEVNARRVLRVTPSGTVTPFTNGLSANAQPVGITAGPDGNMWFTEAGGNRIGRITPSGLITEFSAGLTPGAEPRDIAAGPDGNLWFTERSGSRIGRITPGGTITEFTKGMSQSAVPYEIAAGPDGALWFTEYRIGRIGRIDAGLAPIASGNRLRNPGFEDGARPQALGVAPVPGWATTPNFTSAGYGSREGVPPPSTAAARGGENAFGVGGPANLESRAIQQVDVSADAEAIDEGRATAALSALMGGKAGDDDRVTVTATYLSGAAATLGSGQIGPVTRADRNDETTLVPRGREDVLPAGTRAVRVTVHAERLTGLFNDGFVDNVGLTLAIKPRPPKPVAPATPPATGTPPAGAAPPLPPLPPAAVLDRLAPVLTGARLTSAAFRSSAIRRPRAPLGSSIRLTLSEPASLNIAVERRAAGRRSGRRCVAPSRARRGRRCVRFLPRGAVTAPASQGANVVPFSGRVGAGPLAAGSYRAVITATDRAGNRSAPRTLTFRIVRR